VGHLISSIRTTFTEEKRLQVLDFPVIETEKALLQFIGLANHFHDHVPNIDSARLKVDGLEEVIRI
jgi:hypothetical protein